MSTREEEFLKRLRATFRLEAEEHLQAMSNCLLELERMPPEEQADALEIVFREAHSLKGAARAVNMGEVEDICQALESVFAAWKKDQITASAGLFDTLNRAIDTLTAVLENPETTSGGSLKPGVTPLVAELQQWIDAKGARAAGTLLTSSSGVQQAPAAPEEPQETADSTNSTNGPGSGEMDGGITVEQAPGSEPRVPSAQGSAAEAAVPPAREETATDRMGGLVTVVAPSIATHRRRHDDLLVEPAPTAATASRPTERPVVGETVRIATAKLDSLLLQAEELLSAKLTLAERASDIREIYALLDLYEKKCARAEQELRVWKRKQGHSQVTSASSSPASPLTPERMADFLALNRSSLRLLENRVSTLAKSIEQDRRSLGSMVDGLLDDMKRVLMMPFSSLLEVFPRLIRDLARSLDKDVQLVMHGGEIEIDRRILEEMKDPLIHLLRNSVDHGLELPAERERNGKPPSGTVSVLVRPHEGTQVEIVVSDDGRGIDAERVRSAAVKLGQMEEEESHDLSEQETLMLIFRSEVSTSSMITDVSGRGLGMAIVREKVEKMGGHISLETSPGQGTTFRIVLPMTLATFRGILVETAQQQFVLPTTSIERVVRVERESVKTIGRRPSIIIDGKPVALVALSEVLERRPFTNSEPWLSAIVLGSGEKRIAFQVDEILDEHEILVKGLGYQLSRVRNIAGATVLGSGRVVPILNVADLLKSAVRTGSVQGTLPALSVVEDEGPQRKKSILIAEDSITSRMLLKNILESAGYSVKTTVDGAEAFAALKSDAYDLVVSDIEMPRLNGFELTEKIRGDRQVGNTPVVLVTSLSSREHQERGMDAGANAYIVKSSFDQGNLLDTVRRLI